MRRITIAAAALTLGVAAALGISACGGDDETTTITQPAAGDTTATQTGTTTGTATTTTQGPEDCGEGQVFSQGSGTCVDIRDGDNPCPQGEVPMADEPVCVPRN